MARLFFKAAFFFYFSVFVLGFCEGSMGYGGGDGGWDDGGYRRRVPRDVMVNVINDLGLALLEVHNEHNENNIAISPYGATSVLVALVEGLRGDAAHEIKYAIHLPQELSIVRIGLRDIHRHLKSYFIPKEGFLAGLTLSHENITLNREYESILRFYGYDVDSFNNPVYPEPFSTTPVPTTITTSVPTTITPKSSTNTTPMDQITTETLPPTTTEEIARMETDDTTEVTIASTENLSSLKPEKTTRKESTLPDLERESAGTTKNVPVRETMQVFTETEEDIILSETRYTTPMNLITTSMKELTTAQETTTKRTGDEDLSTTTVEVTSEKTEEDSASTTIQEMTSKNMKDEGYSTTTQEITSKKTISDLSSENVETTQQISKDSSKEELSTTDEDPTITTERLFSTTSLGKDATTTEALKTTKFSKDVITTEPLETTKFNKDVITTEPLETTKFNTDVITTEPLETSMFNKDVITTERLETTTFSKDVRTTEALETTSLSNDILTTKALETTIETKEMQSDAAFATASPLIAILTTTTQTKDEVTQKESATEELLHSTMEATTFNKADDVTKEAGTTMKESTELATETTIKVMTENTESRDGTTMTDDETTAKRSTAPVTETTVNSDFKENEDVKEATAAIETEETSPKVFTKDTTESGSNESSETISSDNFSGSTKPVLSLIENNEQTSTETQTETTTLVASTTDITSTMDVDERTSIMSVEEGTTFGTTIRAIRKRNVNEASVFQLAEINENKVMNFEDDIYGMLKITANISSPNHKQRRKRSVIDYLIARYYDNYYISSSRRYLPPPAPKPHYSNYQPEIPYTFFVNGKYRESNISFMTYDTVLPFYYIPGLDAMALSFPLDSNMYYLLLVLPVDEQGIDKLIRDFRKVTTLENVVQNLKYTHVKAVIPSFTLKGYVVLTPSLQKLCIRKIFEPRHADFSQLTPEKDIYVTNIEQAVTVTIRNYMDPSSGTGRNLQAYRPVEFKADHPFLYFVMDSQIHVNLMAGKIINPLNSRIR